jgi:DNA replicative helicase MCM subunit Mcm2 (Cdc46/Mcm family)
MQFIDENGKIPEDLPMTIDVQVTGNEMFSVYTMKEQADEDNAKAIAESVAATFETQEAMQNLKTSMEEMTGSGIDVNKVVMGIRYLNADGSVIYEKSYTYEDLTKALEPAA